MLRSLFLSALCIFSAQPSQACDLALALAVDVSGSVDRNEFRIQMDGLAEGLRDPLVSEALVRGKAHLMLVQWTGTSRQQISLPWTGITTFADIDRFADQVATSPRVWRNFSTAIGEALLVTMDAFADAPDCTRNLIDLSGDGFSNEGVEPARLHPALRAKGITVNAIAIEDSEPELTAYFFDNVIVGEGAFVVSATGFADYPSRIRKKLLREVTQQTAALQ